MKNQKEFYDIYDLSEAIYLNNSFVEPGDSFCIATKLYNAGYRKQSNDVVEVVRCKDCKHLLVDGFCFKNISGVGYKKPSQDDFCSSGETK